MGLWMVPADKMQEFRLMGDINGDGVIDDADVALLQAAWGSTPSDPNWNADCDLNGDGTVGTMDLHIFNTNYGKDVFTWMGWPEQGIIEWGIIGGAVAAIAAVGVAVYILIK